MSVQSILLSVLVGVFVTPVLAGQLNDDDFAEFSKQLSSGKPESYRKAVATLQRTDDRRAWDAMTEAMSSDEFRLSFGEPTEEPRTMLEVDKDYPVWPKDYTRDQMLAELARAESQEQASALLLQLETKFPEDASIYLEGIARLKQPSKPLIKRLQQRLRELEKKKGRRAEMILARTCARIDHPETAKILRKILDSGKAVKWASPFEYDRLFLGINRDRMHILQLCLDFVREPAGDDELMLAAKGMIFDLLVQNTAEFQGRDDLRLPDIGSDRERATLAVKKFEAFQKDPGSFKMSKDQQKHFSRLMAQLKERATQE